MRLKAEHLPTPTVRPVAIKIYQDGMRRFPLSYKIAKALSELYQKDKSESAIEILQTARRTPVVSFSVTKLLISLYQRYRCNSEAFNEAQRLTVTHKSQWETYEVIWDVLQGSDMTLQERLDVWISLSSQDSPRWEVFIYLAYCYIDLHEYKLAVQACHASIEIYPHISAAWVCCDTYQLLERYEEALSILNWYTDYGLDPLAEKKLALLRHLKKWETLSKFLRE